MELVALPAFRDNYIWMLHDTRQAAVVDPGDAQPVLDALSRLGLQLRAILVTHHHPDHVGGIGALRPALLGPVFTPANEPIEAARGADHPVREHDVIEVLGAARFGVIDVPGHTAGHVAYQQLQPPAEGGLLFCGDTLFSGGCGRLFEGTAAQMQASLAKLAALPDQTLVCCTHEYTLANLRFAALVEPGNTAVQAWTTRCEHLRAQGRPTLPTRLGDERRHNPFLRWAEPEVVAAAKAHGALGRDPAEVFGALRRWKDEC